MSIQSEVDNVVRFFKKFQHVRGSGLKIKKIPLFAHLSIGRMLVITGIAMCYGFDWRPVMGRIPYYNQKFKEMDEES